MKAIRTVLRFTVGIAMGLALGITALVGIPNVIGGKSFTVMSGSMTPAILAGDVVIDERIHPLDARIGDIITFQDPHRKRLLTHRLRSVRRRDNVMEMVTKGDANNTVERWSMPVRGELGRVRYRVPVIGRLLWRTRTPQARIFMVALPALALGLFELFGIWRPRRKSHREPDALATHA
jgi:signal peptidase